MHIATKGKSWLPARPGLVKRAGLVAWVFAVVFFMLGTSGPVEVPVAEGHSCRLPSHSDLVPCRAQRLAVNDASVKEVATV